MFKYRVRFSATSNRGQGDLPGVFDMLRYDASTVTDWTHVTAAHSPSGDEFWTLTLRSPRRPVVDRWASFGLVVTYIEEVS